MAALKEYTGELTIVRCWCGIQHAVPESLRGLQMRQFHDGKRPRTIYCPLGHQHCPSGTSDVEVVRQHLQRERARHDQTKAELRETEARRRGEKAAKTRLKNRVGRGVCPCCHRHFTNLERHMGMKHPEFVRSD